MAMVMKFDFITVGFAIHIYLIVGISEILHQYVAPHVGECGVEISAPGQIYVFVVFLEIDAMDIMCGNGWLLNFHNGDIDLCSDKAG